MSKSKLANRISGLPWATIEIIVLNVLVTVLARRDFANFARDYGLVPAHLHMGRLLTANFVHDGYVHLTMNMFILYIFGRDIERAIGKLEFILFYIGACFAASLLHVAIVFATLPPYYAERVTVGASGAVAGVLGLYAVRFHRKVFKFAGMEVQALFLIACWLVMQIGLGILGLYESDLLGLPLRSVAYWSHLGGFVFGMATALIANMALQGEREYLLESAKRNYEARSFLEAVQNYESLIKYDPDNAFAHAELGRLWALLDEERQSLPYYQIAIELDIRQGKEDQALKVAEEMRRFWPNVGLSAATRFRLASYLEEVGQPERAVGAFREIAEGDPKSNEAQMSLLKIGQAQLSAEQDANAAVATLAGFLDRYPDSEWRGFAEEMLARARSA